MGTETTQLTPDPSGKPFEQLLTYAEVAEILRITTRTISTYVSKGLLPAVRFGGSVRFEPADIRAFVDLAKQPPGKEGVS